MSKVLGIIFSDMHDAAMGELTEHRTMGSVPFGGRYRLIDFTLSNMVNSGISDVGIITKSNYQSLMDHVGSGKEWDLSRKKGGLCILPPYGREDAGYYRGRLEALYGIRNYIKNFHADYVVLSDCDMVTSINFEDMIRYHKKCEADITVAYQNKKLISNQVQDTSVLKLDEHHRVVDTLVNPEVESGNVNLNMVVIRKDLLERIIRDAASHNEYNMLKTVFQRGVNDYRIYGYEHTGYVADIKGMSSFYECNLELLRPEVRSALFPTARPVYTKVRDEVPVKYGISANVKNSMIADGCVIQGTVENSLIFRGVKIGKGAVVRNCVIMQGTVVGENSHLDSVITDKDVLIRDSRTLVGCASYPMYISKGSAV